MNFVRTWLLPAALATTQVLVWPGIDWWLGPDPAPATLAVGLAATGLATVALGLRMRAPATAFVALTLVVGVANAVLPRPAHVEIMALGEPIALYSVAARRPLRTGLVACAVLPFVDGAVELARSGPGLPVLGEVVASALLMGLVFALGRSRHRWRGARQETADRLARAERERRTAATAERERLARELHDVAAHHLTSIVVTATAAERLTDQPELLAEALAFAATTGRETLTALHRLVAVMDTGTGEDGPPLRDRLAELADGFVRLGQPVTITGDGADEPLPAAVAEAAHGIVREALTNALRYARGGAVTVRLRRGPDALEVSVDNEAVNEAGERLGSGRGLTGMRERATALGGTLTAGPRTDGGFTVRATLPLPAVHAVAAPAPAPARDADPPTRPRRRLRHEHVIDIGVVVASIWTPFLFTLGTREEADPASRELVRPLPLTMILLLLTAHAIPLLWRRRAPWWVLAAVVAANATWPAAVAAHLLPQSTVLLAPGAVAGYAAVYTLASLGRPTWATWISVPVLAAGVGASLVAALSTDGSLGGQPIDVMAAALTAVMYTLCLASVAFGAWGAGFAVRMRRDRILGREQGALGLAAARAADAARGERYRIAWGLRESVLDLTGRVIATADAGRRAVADGDPATARRELSETAAGARAGLAAMRELLEVLRSGAPTADRAPQPTAAGIEQLCRNQREAGRAVTLRGEPAPHPLPAAVDVSAYRIVAATLNAGDTGPAEVTIHYGEDDLRITVTGVHAATVGPVAVALRERVDAFGGRITFGPAGTVDVLLPARIEEVTPSPSG
jgi:signal transduction histidine kinase